MSAVQQTFASEGCLFGRNAAQELVVSVDDGASWHEYRAYSRAAGDDDTVIAENVQFLEDNGA